MNESIPESKRVERVRVAFGTGVLLGLWRGRLAAAPTTAHLLTYSGSRCSANCKFCAQARESTADPRVLSRVIWPLAELGRVLEALRSDGGKFQRLCIQTVNYPGVLIDLCELVERVRDSCSLPISVCSQSLTQSDIRRIFEVGAERVCIPLDAATPEIFERVKGSAARGPYSWEEHLKALEDARSIFGGRVSTRLIVGLGESELEAVRTIELLDGIGITIALFALNPIEGTPLEKSGRPDLSSYRRIQLAHYLITHKLVKVGAMKFDDGSISDFGVDRGVLYAAVNSGEPFRTSGCPECNRPFYCEFPRGPIYNYPRKPTPEEIEAIKFELNLIQRKPNRSF